MFHFKAEESGLQQTYILSAEAIQITNGPCPIKPSQCFTQNITPRVLYLTIIPRKRVGCEMIDI